MPFCVPKSLPLGPLLAVKIDQKIDPKSDCSKSRSKTAPRPPKTAPRGPQEPPRCPPGPPWTAQNALPDPPWTAQKAFPKHLALDFFPKRLFVQRSSEKSENSKSSKTSRKKSRQRSSAVVIPHNPAQKSKELSQRSDPQRVAAVVARSALQSAAPSRRPARRVVSHTQIPFFQKLSSSELDFVN